jgi:hypothetical protein
MDRGDLARRLIGEGEPFAACRRAVLSGAPFWIDEQEHLTSASVLASIYAQRHKHTTRRGIPTAGFAAAVDALRAHGEQLVRIGAVDVPDPPYHYQLFLTQDLTTVVAVLGVDQHLGYRLRPGEKVMLSCEVVGWVREGFPGWVRVRLVDAERRAWFLVDKARIFGVDVPAEAAVPMPAMVRCAVVGVIRNADGEPPRLVVSTALDGVAAEDGTDQFIVTGDMLSRTPCL